MKLFKLFLGIFSVAFVFAGASAMEIKTQEPKASITITQLPKDMLNIILKMVIRETGNNITEAELFQATNNLRLVNKQFNSLIQDYINKQKELKPEIYATLTTAQAYKQFQLDMINEKVNEFIRSKGSATNSEIIDFTLNNLKAFNWLIEDYAKPQYKKFKKEDEEGWKQESIKLSNLKILEEKFKNIRNKIIDFFKNSSKEDFKSIDSVLSFIENHKEYKGDKFKELKNLIENYVGLSKRFDEKSSDPIKALKEKLKSLLVEGAYSNSSERYHLTEKEWDNAMRWEAYDWIKNSKSGQQLFKNYMKRLLFRADSERLEKLLDDKRLNINPNEKLNEDIERDPLSGELKNILQVLILQLAYQLNDKDLNLNEFHKAINLLLSKYNSQASLAQKEISLLKQNLKKEESKMSYKSQYAGYDVPEKIKKLRDIVSLLEKPQTKEIEKEEFKPVGKSWFKW